MAYSQKEPDAAAIKDDKLQYGHGPLTPEELEEKYPDRPHNHSKTLPFHELFKSLFNPLEQNKKGKPGPKVARAKQGPHGPTKLSPHEARENIITRFISRWRDQVGNDIYPALRLIIPEQDRDRPMYGLKEKAIGKLLVKLMKISSDSEDGYNLLNWKLPGQNAARMAGDFPGTCYNVLSKRTMRSAVGTMRIAEVNKLLDDLAAANGEAQQMPIFETFYERMNAEELTWLIRIILRQMKLGASEKTILNLWHPDGEALFNVSSNLRRVCWELKDPNIRINEDEGGIALMSCFQPQLAQFSMENFNTMLTKMGCIGETPEFWIEEKLDGERMQMHMTEDDTVPGGRRFAFWSRKAKDYTYLYGDSLEDENSALTRHLKDGFEDRVRNIILDGEMITWDFDSDMMVPFGTLKTAAIEQQKDPFSKGHRPLFRVFDCLYLNDTDITRYELKDRYNALKRSVNNVHRRLEILTHVEATQVNAIEPLLRQVIAEAAEGLVLKNPRSMYQLNQRNNDWFKVKPEYMSEFGESLDCLVLGGYYGQGNKGGRIASFLCGLRVTKNIIDSQGVSPMKFYSFFKVGGGFRSEDYDKILHLTAGKWVDWNAKDTNKESSTKYIDLGGADGQLERPDVWIKPTDSFVVQVKAASVGSTTSFKTGYTLRFPRFQRLRMDKNWESALSIDDFIDLKAKAEAESKDKEMKVDGSRKKISKRLKKELSIAGSDGKVKTRYGGPRTKVLEGFNFCVLSEMLHPIKKSKAEVEDMIKSNGGSIFQSPTARDDICCVAEKKVVKVASLMKSGQLNVVKPAWILDVLSQADIDGPGKDKFLLPFEPSHMFYMRSDDKERIEGNVDMYGDSYTRDVSVDELKKVLDDMVPVKNSTFSPTGFLSQLEEHGKGLGEMRGTLFRNCVVYFAPSANIFENLDADLERRAAKIRFAFAAGKVAQSLEEEITHVVVTDREREHVKALREKIAGIGGKIPRMVGWNWLLDSWIEGTLLDEERYAIVV